MNEPHDIDLAVRAAEARGALRSCDLCARRCGVDRASGATGYCGVGARSRWFRELVIYGIEMELIPAHAVYLCGCNMRCAFCNVEPWNLAPAAGEAWDPAWMARRVEQRRAEGGSTLLVLGGEPTVNLPAVLDMLARVKDKPRVAWDSNMLLSERSRGLLDGIVDVYVADLKFGNNACARRLADFGGYLEIVGANLKFAERTAGLIVRHLMLPGHFECCTIPALQWLSEIVEKPRLSLNRGYRPPSARPEFPELSGSIDEKEFEQARGLAIGLGMELV